MTMESEFDREVQHRIDIALENQQIAEHDGFVERMIEQQIEDEETEMLEVQFQVEELLGIALPIIKVDLEDFFEGLL